MQCTSFVPVYHQPRGVKGENGFSWHLSGSNNVNYGAPTSFDRSFQPSTVNPYLSYDKDVLKQIIQNHEAIFRHQVQELHRLYKRQRELMDEMRMREIVAQHLLPQTSESMQCLSQPRSDITQTSHTPSWFLGDHLNGKLPDLTVENIQQSPNFVLDNFPEHATVGHGPFVRKSSCHEVEYLSSRTKENGKRVMDLELPADVCHDVEATQFKECKISGSPDVTDDAVKNFSHVWPASGSEIGSVKTGDLSKLNCARSNCLIDLNEPVQLESLSSNSTGAFGAYTVLMETVCSDPCVSGEAKLESPLCKCAGVLNCDVSSDGINSSLAIDLNSMPVSCFSEAETSTENFLTIKKEPAVHGCSSGHDHAMKKGPCADDSALLDGAIDGNFSKTQTNIDLDVGVADGNDSPPPSGTIKSAGNTDLKHPARPENEDPPPRGNTSDVQLQMHTLPVKGEKKHDMELDIIAAQTLVVIYSSEFEECTESANPQLLGNCLNWFAAIACSTGDDLENKIAEVQNDATNNDQGGILPSGGHDFEVVTPKVHKDKETGGALSTKSPKGNTREAKLQQRRNASKKAPAKPIKYPKIVSADAVKKSMSSILKQPGTNDREGILQAWGKIRKRQGGHRRRTGKFLFYY